MRWEPKLSLASSGSQTTMLASPSVSHAELQPPPEWQRRPQAGTSALVVRAVINTRVYMTRTSTRSESGPTTAPCRRAQAQYATVVGRSRARLARLTNRATGRSVWNEARIVTGLSPAESARLRKRHGQKGPFAPHALP